MKKEKKSINIFVSILFLCLAVFLFYMMFSEILDTLDSFNLSPLTRLLCSVWIVILFWIIYLNLEYNFEKKFIYLLPFILNILFLLGAYLPNNPYDYFVILRLNCFIIFGYLAILASNYSQKGIIIICVISSLIYNPLFPLHLERNLWLIINGISIFITLLSLYLFRKNEMSKKNEVKGS